MAHRRSSLYLVLQSGDRRGIIDRHCHDPGRFCGHFSLLRRIPELELPDGRFYQCQSADAGHHHRRAGAAKPAIASTRPLPCRA